MGDAGNDSTLLMQHSSTIHACIFSPPLHPQKVKMSIIDTVLSRNVLFQPSSYRRFTVLLNVDVKILTFH
jgi:hypothetical protein